MRKKKFITIKSHLFQWLPKTIRRTGHLAIWSPKIYGYEGKNEIRGCLDPSDSAGIRVLLSVPRKYSMRYVGGFFQKLVNAIGKMAIGDPAKWHRDRAKFQAGVAASRSPEELRKLVSRYQPSGDTATDIFKIKEEDANALRSSNHPRRHKHRNRAFIPPDAKRYLLDTFGREKADHPDQPLKHIYELVKRDYDSERDDHSRWPRLSLPKIQSFLKRLRRK